MDQSTFKVLLLGTTGSFGQAVAREALADYPSGTVTIFVRNRAKLASLLESGLLEKARVCSVVEGSLEDTKALAEVMKDQHACISTAGNATKDSKEGYLRLFAAVVDVADKHLIGPRRLWMMGGVTLMNVPPSHSKLTINDLPIFSRLPFTIHAKNFEHLLQAGASLDWSIMCPGQLQDSDQSGLQPQSKTSVDQASVWLPAFTLYFPFRIFASLLILSQLGKFSLSYKSIAEFMVANLKESGDLSKKRVALHK